jgi:hypothetical protein
MTLGSLLPDPTHRRRFTAVSILAVAAGAVCLLIPVLVNGFPFVFPDSVDYLVFTPHIYRSPFYGLFIFFFHQNHFIWAPIVAQALIASHLIWVLCRIKASEASLRYFVFSILLLSFLSSLPFFVGFLMPDLLTSVMILTIYLLFFDLTMLSMPERLYFVFMACVAIAAHLSHLPLAIALAGVAGVLHVGLGMSRRSLLRSSVVLAIPLGLASCAIFLNNAIVHRSFALFPTGQSFVLANMLEYGPARHYLQQACPTAGYKLCGVLGAIPATSDGFLWTSGMYERLGGFVGMREEAGQIVIASIRTYPLEVLEMAVRNIVAAFVTHAPGAELGPLSSDRDYWITKVLAQKFGAAAVRAYKDSFQSRDLVPRAFLRRVDDLAFPTSIVVLLAAGIWALRRGLTEVVSFGLFVVAAFVINNALCAVGSGVFDRYQARVTWLIAFSALLVVAQALRSNDGSRSHPREEARISPSGGGGGRMEEETVVSL